MITDEMIKTAKQHLPAEIDSNVFSALEAIYPLIRAQVIEECAQVCEKHADVVMKAGRKWSYADLGRVEITHCLMNGERVEIALTDGETA